jgi:hypothetical protein
MLVAMQTWKRENPGRPVPLAMFATVANAVMWLWTTVGVAVELLFQVIPAAFGLIQTIDVGLARTCLAHFWVAFAAFLVASLLGAWQMWVRSPLGANIGTPSQYFLSVTAHGAATGEHAGADRHVPHHRRERRLVDLIGDVERRVGRGGLV